MSAQNLTDAQIDQAEAALEKRNGNQTHAAASLGTFTIICTMKLADTEVASALIKVDQKLDLIITNQETIMTTQADIAAALTKVQADVAAQTTMEASVVTFIQGLQTQIAAISTTTTDTTTAAALAALSTQIEANTSGLSTAIAANTAAPAAAVPTPTPDAPAAA